MEKHNSHSFLLAKFCFSTIFLIPKVSLFIPQYIKLYAAACKMEVSFSEMIQRLEVLKCYCRPTP